MREVFEILDRHLKKYFIVPNSDGVVILFFKNFLPFKRFDKDICEISAFYLTSNLMHLQCIEVCNDLNAKNILSKIYKEHNLKELGFKYCGLTKGRNDLLFDKNFGSYFVIGAVQIFQNLPHLAMNEGSACLNCDKCVKACPTDALKDGFYRDICLREIMNNKTFDNFYSEKLSNKILGCEICQSVCPLNEKIEKIEMPMKLKELLKIKNILNDQQQTYKELEKYIGKNYSKRTRVLNLALNSAKNTKDKSYLPQIENFLNDLDENVKLNAKSVYEFLSGK